MIKRLYVWQDEQGTVFRDTAVISTDQHISEDNYCTKTKANRMLFEYWCGSRFKKAGDYFCDKFADMARENGWKLIEIELPEEQTK